MFKYVLASMAANALLASWLGGSLPDSSTKPARGVLLLDVVQSAPPAPAVLPEPGQVLQTPAVAVAAAGSRRLAATKSSAVAPVSTTPVGENKPARASAVGQRLVPPDKVVNQLPPSTAGASARIDKPKPADASAKIGTASPAAQAAATSAKPNSSKTPVANGTPAPASLAVAADIVRPARYRHRSPPVYPRRAIQLGQQGVVILHAQILANGAPHTIKIATSSGYRLLDTAAIGAVKKWRFEPPTVNEIAGQGWVSVPVRFSLEPRRQET